DHAVHAALGRQHQRLGVLRVRRADADDVDAAGVEHRPGADVPVAGAAEPPATPPPPRARAAPPRPPPPAAPPPRWPGRGPAVAGADDADPNLRGHGLRSLSGGEGGG